MEEVLISLTAEEARFVEAQVASGAYASAAEVVRAGLRVLRDDEADLERWLREEVVPAYDAHMADPSRAIPAEEVWRDLQAHHEARAKAGGTRDAA